MATRRHDVVCLGEALVDFLPDRRGLRVRDVARWSPRIGGAPANVAVGVARLSGRSALVGVTGGDEFGHFLREGLAKEGVDVSHLRLEPGGRTGLGFVSLTRAGERSFVFFREQSSEKHLTTRDVRRAAGLISRARVLHVGTNSLLHPGAREAALEAVERAAGRGQIVSVDPNLRLHLWPRPGELKALLRRLLPSCAVVKLSDEEIRFVTGQSDVDAALRWLGRRGPSVAVVTLGARGAAVRAGGQTLWVPAPKVTAIDTTGAGDGFMAGFLYGLARLADGRRGLDALRPEQLAQVARFGCLIGARAVTRLGAVPGLPHLKSVAAQAAALLRS